jgi:hypothetical protein
MDISTSSEEDAPPLATTDTRMPLGCTSSNSINLLSPPITVATGNIATGAITDKLRKQNRQYRDEALAQQSVVSQWSIHRGDTILAEDHWVRCINTAENSEMALQGLALKHEAADILTDWAQFGCPTNTGRDWTLADIQLAINRGPHKSALEPEALAHFAAEVRDKVKKGQARVVCWDDIKGNHPRQLKVSPVAAIRHKYRAYRSIVNLSFALCLVDGGVVKLVNSTTHQLAPWGAINQLGHSLKRIIHAFVEVADDEKIQMAKWDIQDRFWRHNCQKEEEWNFCYVWPQAPSAPTQLVVPTSLQMGWVESPPYFCAASETARGVAVEYIEMKIETLPQHKFDELTDASQARVNDSTLKKEL